MQADTERTRAWYQTLDKDELCDCAPCRNYRALVRAAYPELTAYLAALGVDVEKPFQVSYLEPDEQGMLSYIDCQYGVYGQCEDGFHEDIGGTEARLGVFFPDPGMEDGHFVLEIGEVKLKAPAEA